MVSKIGLEKRYVYDPSVNYGKGGYLKQVRVGNTWRTIEVTKRKPAEISLPRATSIPTSSMQTVTLGDMPEEKRAELLTETAGRMKEEYTGKQLTKAREIQAKLSKYEKEVRESEKDSQWVINGETVSKSEALGLIEESKGEVRGNIQNILQYHLGNLPDNNLVKDVLLKEKEVTEKKGVYMASPPEYDPTKLSSILDSIIGSRLKDVDPRTKSPLTSPVVALPVGVGYGFVQTGLGIGEYGVEKVIDWPNTLFGYGGGLKMAEEIVGGTVEWAFNIPEKVVGKGFFGVGEVIGEVLAMEAGGRAISKVTGKAGKRIETKARETLETPKYDVSYMTEFYYGSLTKKQISKIKEMPEAKADFIIAEPVGIMKTGKIATDYLISYVEHYPTRIGKITDSGIAKVLNIEHIKKVRITKEPPKMPDMLGIVTIKKGQYVKLGKKGKVAEVYKGMEFMYPFELPKKIRPMKPADVPKTPFSFPKIKKPKVPKVDPFTEILDVGRFEMMMEKRGITKPEVFGVPLKKTTKKVSKRIYPVSQYDKLYGYAGEVSASSLNALTIISGVGPSKISYSARIGPMKPIEIFDIKPKTAGKIKTKVTIKESLMILDAIGPATISRLEVDVGSMLGLDVALGTKQVTRQRYRQKLESPLETVFRYDFLFPRPTKIKYPPFDPFKLEEGEGVVRGKGKKKKKAKGKGKYTPSVTAIEFDIVGKAPKVITGVEIRPLGKKKKFKDVINEIL